MTNPVFTDAGVMNAELAAKARGDLDEIIDLSDRVKKHAANLNKANAQVAVASQKLRTESHPPTTCNELRSGAAQIFLKPAPHHRVASDLWILPIFLDF